MAAQQSPFSVSDTATCSTPGYPPAEGLKRKRSISGPQPAREYGLMRDSGEHDVPRFIGSSSGIFYIRAVYLRLARKSALRTQAKAKSDLVPGEDDQLAGAETAESSQKQGIWRPEEVTQVSSGAHLQTDFEDLVEWSKNYFELWHPPLPFLHGPDVLQSFEKISREGINFVDPLERVIVKSVLSISLADSRQSSPYTKAIPSCLVFQDIEEAVASSQFALSQPASIRATQAALSIQLFLTSMLRLNAASRLGGLIVRMAFHLGLHRCPARFPFFTPDVAITRRRVFWCIYILERMLCQFLGLPLDIQDDDIDVCYPGEEQHSESGAAEDAKRLILLTYVAKHARIRGLILELRNKSILKRHDTADRAAFVQTELAKWSNEIQDIVEDDAQSEDASDSEAVDQPTISPGHRLMLLVLQHESTIGLNRPGLATESATISYASAFQSCASAAKSIWPGLATPLVWPSLTYAVWISAFVLIHAACEGQVPLESALRNVKAGKEMLSHLATRGTSWPEYCKGAVDELISAIKELANPRNAPPSMVDLTEGSRVEQQLRDSDSRPRPQKRRLTMAESEHNSGIEKSAHTNEPNRAGSNRNTIDVNPSNWQGAASRTAATQDAQDWRQLTTPSAQPTQSQSYSSDNATLGYGQAPSSSTVVGPPALDDAAGADLAEGQQPMMWYDQLFASSFSAIDNPFLVAAEFDASIDPTWNYLT
ncbi:Transcriptional activator protein acu-15 [Paramyrothecium foliicola]|nr:Transcriptional activator protein acu-15 [Paramyrothecium foliicola]